MNRVRALSACILPLALGLCPSAAAAAARSPAGRSAATARQILHSPALWATINVCSPTDQPDWVGIRGSMPGDGLAGDRMYMRFTLQDFNRKKRVWVNLPGTAEAEFVLVGNGRYSREEGESFQLQPVVGKRALELRGVVDYRWRRGKTVLLSARRFTTAGHRSHAGADPAGFTASSCQIG